MRSMNLKNRIVVYSIVVLIANLLIIGLSTFWIASSAIYKSVVETNESVAIQTMENIDFVLRSIERETVNAMENVDFNRYLTSGDEMVSTETIIRNKTELSQLFTRFINVTNNVVSVYLVGKDGQVYTDELVGENERWDEPTFRRLLEHREGEFIWTYAVAESGSVSRKLIGISKAVYDEQGDYNGFILVLLNEQTLANAYPSKVTKLMMLTDQSQRIISSNDAGLVGAMLPEQLAVPVDGHEIRSDGRQSYMMSAVESGYSGWKLYVATPYKHVIGVLLTERIDLVVLTMVCLLTFIGLIVAFAHRLVAPLTRLNDAAHAINRSSSASIDAVPQLSEQPGFFGRIHFKTRMAFILTIYIVMPVMILMILSYSFTRSLAEQKIVEVITISAEQTIRRVNSFTTNLEKAVYYFYYDERLIETLRITENPTLLRLSGPAVSTIEQSVENALTQKKDIAFVDFLDLDMKLIYSSKRRPQTFMYPLPSPSALDRNGWLDTYRDDYKDDLITFGRKLVDVEKDRMLGYLFITINEKDFAAQFASTQTDWSDTFVINKERRIMSHTNAARIGTELGPELSALLDPVAHAGQTVADLGGPRVVSYADIGNTGWRIVNVASLEAVNESMERILLYDLLVLIGSLLSIVVFVIRYTGQISRPINELTRQVVAFTSERVGDYERATKNGDEIEQLRSNFKLMISKIDTLIKEVYEIRLKKNEAELKQKEAELITLQAQINPHFLYNTLEVIRWKSTFQMGGSNEVSDLVATLSEYFRLSLSQGRRTITLAEEIDHVKRYVKIMNHRYKDKIDFHCDVPDELHRLIVPKIMLQPIVENALYHGIKLRKATVGTILIAARQEHHRLTIVVTDNGVGMDEAKLEQLRHHISLEAETAQFGEGGYGLRNVQQRIRMLFGPAYGIGIDSASDIGTTVSVRLPARETAGNNENS